MRHGTGPRTYDSRQFATVSSCAQIRSNSESFIQIFGKMVNTIPKHQPQSASGGSFRPIHSGFVAVKAGQLPWKVTARANGTSGTKCHSFFPFFAETEGFATLALALHYVVLHSHASTPPSLRLSSAPPPVTATNCTHCSLPHF